MGKMTLEEKITGCLKRHPTWPDWQVARSVTCRVADVKAVRLSSSLPTQSEPKKTGLVSIKRVIEKYDIRGAILRELTKLERGQLIQENDLREATAGSDRSRFRRTVENNADEFRPLRIKLKLDDSGDGKWYWGHPEDVAEAQRIRDL